jgi:hypothetical protein
MKLRCTFLFLLLTLAALPAWGQLPPQKQFTPEPATVARYEAGYRYPQAGWIVLHIEGEPYERGYQHGRLLAAEIAAYTRCFAQTLNHKAPAETWRHMRSLINALFLRKFDKEQLEEMKGIADGASAAGARFDGRPIDLVDVVGLNCWSEIDTLDEANAATPTGLEGAKWKDPQPAARGKKAGEHCSAFAATGPATADGKVVFGHVNMYTLYPSNFLNVWIDLKPARGHRFVMCSFPGGIQSGMDYYINAAGILINETTIAQTRLDVGGMTCASRIRKAIQYASTIDQAVDYLVKDGNGLYTNEWLLADINTNEIAMLELGTQKYKLWRSSKGEWFGGTPGFYWGCNNVKDLDVRLETVPSAKGRPAEVVFRPTPRDLAWVKAYDKHKGKIGVEFAKETLTSEVLAPPTATDAKFTTTALAKELKSWAVFGPPTGKTWEPSAEEKQHYPEVKALVKNEWTLLGAVPPAKHAANVPAPMLKVANDNGNGASESELLWRGTILPKSDGDLWLAIAFARYHDVLADEKAALKRGEKAKEAAARVEKDLEHFRDMCGEAGQVALADVRLAAGSEGWYDLACGKGVLLLHQLRRDLGAEVFDKAMDDFGMKYGGLRVTTQQFQQHLEQASERKLDGFFKTWWRDKGLPK